MQWSHRTSIINLQTVQNLPPTSHFLLLNSQRLPFSPFALAIALLLGCFPILISLDTITFPLTKLKQEIDSFMGALTSIVRLCPLIPAHDININTIDLTFG